MPPDFELWAEVQRSVKPLRRARAASPAKPTPSPRRKEPAPPPPSHPPARARRADPEAPPPLAAFDRRTSQKMTRGQVDIERRLDLHGTGIEMARVRLLQFLRQAAAEGARTVLVITGKGASPYARHTLHGKAHFHASEREGRLRRLVPEWLHEADFRSLVSGFQPAHPRHGGGGAFYLRLRRQR
jgi:DNA-nicking Smr family endonuclease